MKFFFIAKEGKQDTKVRIFLEQACDNHNIPFIVVIPETFNYLQNTFESKDLVYRAGISASCKAIECQFLIQGGISFHKTLSRWMSTAGDSFYFNQQVGLPIIPTIPDIKNKEALEEYVNYLWGFPVILKVTGGTHGVGVIKVDSMPGLRSLIDYVNALGSKAILRKFINHTSQGRFVVVGDKVVASDRATMSIKYDFRSNIDEDKTRIWEAHTYDKEIENLAIQAVNSFEIEFWWVDLLFETDTGKPYISEVNCPCDFAGTQEKTGIDIASQMVEYLMKKSQK